MEAAQWSGTGECFVATARCPAGCGGIPPPLRRVAGPVLVVAARYDTSPVGSYLELAIAEPVRLGARVGTCATAIVVDSVGSRDAGRTHWGLPKQLGTLQWTDDGDSVALRWEEGGVTVTARPGRRRFPVPVPFWSLQAREDGPVRVSGLMRGSGRFAAVSIDVDDGQPMTCLAGRHRGLHVSAASVTMRPATSVGAHAQNAAPAPST